MSSLRRMFLRAAAAVCVLGSPVAEAGSLYQLVFDQSNYQVDPGGQVVVNVFLQEQVSGGSSSVLATDGLIGAGVRVSFDLPPLPSEPASILGTGDVTPNDGPGGFTGGFQSVSVTPGSHADLTETTEIGSPAVFATDLGGGLFQILIGSFRFTAGSIAGQTTSIQAGDIPGGNNEDWFTGSEQPLDDLISPGTASIQVRGGAVPEPSSLVGLMLGLIGAGGYAIARGPRGMSASDQAS